MKTPPPARSCISCRTLVPAPDDAARIAEIVSAAFTSPDEARLVARLRAAGDVAAELVAGMDGRIVGHILFSRLALRPSEGAPAVAALAPLAVQPEFQNRGIGGALIRAGLDVCRGQGIAAVAVVGDPAYYTRFGFSNGAAAPLRAPYSGPSFMALELVPGALAGGPWRVTYPGAFTDF